MMWSVTTRPWSICNDEEKSRNNSKSLLRNNLQKRSPIKSVNIPLGIPIHIVDATRVVSIIPVANLEPPTFQT